MLALSQDAQQNRPVEAREHIRRFHELFFTLSPDKNAIESNVQRALYLSDESAIGYYRNLQEKGYFLAYIVGGFCGTDKFPIEVRHLQRVALPRTDSIQPFKNNVSNDTIR